MSGSPARRVLLVGNFDRKALMRHYFNTEHKLLNGFIRLGHTTLAFSDRDVARERSLLGARRIGAARMNGLLIETATHFRPHVILFFHSDLIRPETAAALRDGVPGVRLGQINVDPTDRPRTMAAFTGRAQWCDLSFITTAEPEALRRLSPRAGAVSYMPNPVDAAVETAQVWAEPRDRLAHDLLFMGNGDATRPDQLTALRAALPEEVRFEAAGGVFGTKRMSSTAFLDRLATGAQGPNLALDDRKPVPWLYNSNRIALLLGQGVLAHVPASSRQETLYEDGVVPFDSREALAEAVIRFARDDDARRSRAETGWRIAHARTASQRVGRYLLDALLGESEAEAYEWPTARY